ncbi:MAG: metabolite traffic protein EboE, partial [Acidimicrobiales bacterium]
LLAVLAPPDVEPSIQSAPLAFRPAVRDASYVARMTDNVLQVVAHLAKLRSESGRVVTLALEPEPYCYLESTDETIRYFEEELRSPSGVARLAELAGVGEDAAAEALQRHLGVVFDIGHQAVGFEDAAASLRKLRDAKVPIFKLQEAAALSVPEVTSEVVRELERFAHSIYLTQTTELSEGSRRQYLNLEDAIESWTNAPRTAEWRVHFHVPVFLDELGPFRTTRFAIEDALALHRASPLSTHLEIETYTWDVLPAHLKGGDIVEYVSRELDWVISTLEAPEPVA